MKLLTKASLLITLLILLSCQTEMEEIIEVNEQEKLEFISLEDWTYFYPEESKEPRKEVISLSSNQKVEEILKWNNVVIPRYKIRGTLEDAVDTLNKEIKRQKYVKVSFQVKNSLTKKNSFERLISLENVSLNSVLNIISHEFKVSMVVRNGTIVFGNFNFDEVKEKRIHRLTNDFALSLKDKDLESYFSEAGVQFPEGSSIELLHGNYLLMENLQDNHRELERMVSQHLYDNRQLLVVAQIFEITEPAYLRNVVLPYGRHIMAVPAEYRKEVSRIATLATSGNSASDCKAVSCLVRDENQQLESSFIGTVFNNAALIDSDGYTVSVSFRWKHNIEKERRLIKTDGKEQTVSKLKSYYVDQTVKIWDGQSAVVPLEQSSDSRTFLLITPKILTPAFEFAREYNTAEPLNPIGPVELFQNTKTGKIRVFLPAAQDDYKQRLQKNQTR